MEYFAYGETELLSLKKRDEKLGKLIDTLYPPPKRQINPDPFSALVDSIISQQVSGSAAKRIYERLISLLGEITPKAVSERTADELKSCGMSGRKALYIKDIAANADSVLDKARFKNMGDKEIIDSLTGLQGIGVWTAEMFLIFCLQRPDVLSYRDFGIRRGIMRLYGLSELTSVQFEEIRERYSPYGTVASFYLWEVK